MYRYLTDAVHFALSIYFARTPHIKAEGNLKNIKRLTSDLVRAIFKSISANVL